MTDKFDGILLSIAQECEGGVQAEIQSGFKGMKKLTKIHRGQQQIRILVVFNRQQVWFVLKKSFQFIKYNDGQKNGCCLGYTSVPFVCLTAIILSIIVYHRISVSLCVLVDIEL